MGHYMAEICCKPVRTNRSIATTTDERGITAEEFQDRPKHTNRRWANNVQTVTEDTNLLGRIFSREES